MDIFSKQYMWRIKGDHGALKMFLTHRFYFWYNDFIFFFFMSEPSFSLLFQPHLYLDSLAAHFSPHTNLELLMSLLPLFPLFNLPTGSHALLLKLSVLFSIWKHFQIQGGSSSWSQNEIPLRRSDISKLVYL